MGSLKFRAPYNRFSRTNGIFKILRMAILEGLGTAQHATPNMNLI